MHHNQLKVVSLNVNGLNNPMKRGKVVTKLKKEKSQISYLQETHLSDQEHEKFKKLGFKHAFYSSYKGGSKRGVIILIPNTTKFETLKEIKDKGETSLIKTRLGEIDPCFHYDPSGLLQRPLRWH